MSRLKRNQLYFCFSKMFNLLSKSFLDSFKKTDRIPTDFFESNNLFNRDVWEHSPTSVNVLKGPHQKWKMEANGDFSLWN